MFNCHCHRFGSYGGGLLDFDDVSAAVDGFWSGCRGLSLICRLNGCSIVFVTDLVVMIIGLGCTSRARYAKKQLNMGHVFVSENRGPTESFIRECKQRAK